MGFIKRAWKGQEPLWKIYWIYGSLIGLALTAVLRQITQLSIPHLTQIALLLNLIYLIWVNVSIWRCAFNVENKKWGYVARVVVALGIIIAITLFVDGVVSNPLVQRSLECRHRILDDVARSGLTKEEYAKLHPNIYEDCVHPKGSSN